MVGPAKLEMAPEESMFSWRWEELLDASPVSSGESSGQMYWPSMKYTKRRSFLKEARPLMARGNAARLIQSKTDWQAGRGSNQWWRSPDTSDPSRPESHCGWRCKGLSNRYRGWSRRCFGMVRSPKAKGQRSRASTTPCPIVQSVHPSSGTCFDRSPGGGWCWIATQRHITLVA